jgi:hypothetical protein
MINRNHTLDAIRAEIAEYASPNKMPDADCRMFKAKLFPIVSGWDEVVDNSLDIEAELVALVQLAIEGKKTSWGESAETVIGRKLVECALKRVTPEFDDLINEADEARMALDDAPLGRSVETFGEWARGFLGERA